MENMGALRGSVGLFGRNGGWHEEAKRRIALQVVNVKLE